MRLTLTVLLAALACYCNRTAWSLPATLLANKEPLRQHLGKPLSGEHDTIDYFGPDMEMAGNFLLQPMAARKLKQHKTSSPLTPLKYWARHCWQMLDYADCPKEYYHALMSSSNNHAAAIPTDYEDELLAAYQPYSNPNQLPMHPNADDALAAALDLGTDPESVESDSYMMLTGEQDVVKFLTWAMKQLYPYQKFTNLSGNGADFLHPGMYNWKKLNLSGSLEPPLFAEEPRYLIVRREDAKDNVGNLNLNVDLPNHKNDPFIPPRGRKHNLADLEVLLNRYEPFVPNRGKKDKIKDIFKYDDLFYPNRGKRQQNHLPIANNWYNELLQQQQMNADGEIGKTFNTATFLDDISTATTPSVKDTERARVIGMQRMLRKLKRKLQQAENNKKELMLENYWRQLQSQLAAAHEINSQFNANRHNNNNNNGNNKKSAEWPVAAAANSNKQMSTNQINVYDQSAKQSMSTTPTDSLAGSSETTKEKLVGEQQQSGQVKEMEQENVAGLPAMTKATATNFYLQLPAFSKWHALREWTHRNSVNGGNGLLPANRLYSLRSMSMPKAPAADSLQISHLQEDPLQHLKQQNVADADNALGTLLVHDFDAMHGINDA